MAVTCSVSSAEWWVAAICEANMFGGGGGRSTRAICPMDVQECGIMGQERGRAALNSLPWWLKPSGQYCLLSLHPHPLPSRVYIILYLYKLKPCFPVRSPALCSVLLHKDLLEEVILLSSVKKEAACGQNLGGRWVRILLMFLLEILTEGVPGGSVVRTLHSHCWGPRFNPWSGNQDTAWYSQI